MATAGSSVRWLVTGAIIAIVLAVVPACGGGGRDLPEPSGFLPIPTNPTAPPEPTLHERYDICPGLPREACVLPGDQTNLYQAFGFDRANVLHVFEGGSEKWVSEPGEVQGILGMFDREVDLEPYSIVARPLFVLDIEWPPGQGIPEWDETHDSMELILNEETRAIGSGAWQVGLPAGFVSTLLDSLVDEQPTPVLEPRTPVPQPTPEPTNTPFVRLPDAPFFDHPEDELRWDGPADRVHSRGRAHCEAPTDVREAYGVPALVAVDEDVGFWFWRTVKRESDWRWTGYRYGEWQIRQGDDPRAIYLVYAGEDRIAFEYREFGCI
ncbi:MAG: hypothetical protein WD939_04835 [Dehalococcoidia bacterium]